MLTLIIVSQLVLTALSVLLTLLAVGLSVKVQQLEQAMKSMTPDHNLDAVERRLNILEGVVVEGHQATATALKALGEGMVKAYAEAVGAKEYADDTFYRKDHVA